jgi:hypothetical protein
MGIRRITSQNVVKFQFYVNTLRWGKVLHKITQTILTVSKNKDKDILPGVHYPLSLVG